MVFIHLEGHKIFRGSPNFSDKFSGRDPKKFENPCVKRTKFHKFLVIIGLTGLLYQILNKVFTMCFTNLGKLNLHIEVQF